MDITMITSLVSNLGFPIVCVGALGFFIWKLWKRIEITLDRITKTNEQLSATNRLLVEGFTKDMNEVKDMVDDVDKKVDDVDKKIDGILTEIKK